MSIVADGFGRRKSRRKTLSPGKAWGSVASDLCCLEGDEENAAPMASLFSQKQEPPGSGLPMVNKAPSKHRRTSFLCTMPDLDSPTQDDKESDGSSDVKYDKVWWTSQGGEWRENEAALENTAVKGSSNEQKGAATPECDRQAVDHATAQSKNTEPELAAMIREYVKNPGSQHSRDIAMRIRGLSGYPLPSSERKPPPTREQIREMMLSLRPMLDEMQRSKMETAKRMEDTLLARSEQRACDGSYRYLDLVTLCEISPATYCARYMRAIQLEAAPVRPLQPTDMHTPVKPPDQPSPWATPPCPPTPLTPLMDQHEYVPESAEKAGGTGAAPDDVMDRGECDVDIMPEKTLSPSRTPAKPLVPSRRIKQAGAVVSSEVIASVQRAAERKLQAAMDAALRRYHHDVAASLAARVSASAGLA